MIPGRKSVCRNGSVREQHERYKYKNRVGIGPNGIRRAGLHVRIGSHRMKEVDDQVRIGPHGIRRVGDQAGIGPHGMRRDSFLWDND
jgi:hypothetical protein